MEGILVGLKWGEATLNHMANCFKATDRQTLPPGVILQIVAAAVTECCFAADRNGFVCAGSECMSAPSVWKITVIIIVRIWDTLHSGQQQVKNNNNNNNLCKLHVSLVPSLINIEICWQWGVKWKMHHRQIHCKSVKSRLLLKRKSLFLLNSEVSRLGLPQTSVRSVKDCSKTGQATLTESLFIAAGAVGKTEIFKVSIRTKCGPRRWNYFWRCVWIYFLILK